MSRIRGASITLFEDEALCRAYVQVSVDSINSGNQTAETVWEYVSEIYHQQLGIVIARTQSSLQSPYQTISSSVILFITKLSHAMKHHIRGTNEVDWVNFVKL